MSRRRLGALMSRGSRLIAAAVPLACLMLFLVPHQASACSVSYGYKPQVKFSGKDFRLGGGHVCTSGTSLAGSTAVALLVVGALASAGARAFRRGAAWAEASAPGQALTDYLRAAGTVVTVPVPEDSQTGDDGAHPQS
ncbi:hypothetical protein AB0B01_27025 [Streptomyces sp. NPDC044571]|uniref:hypothetical protein n=1 Tax=Streptomyces sp. NPDC044571 TaxID=3155371 RepID=UPI0033DE6F63